MAQLGPFHRVDAGQVEHADTLAVRAEQRRARAAVDRRVVEEMFAPVQPHRAALDQRGADGGRANRCLRQIDPDARDQGCTAVGAVDRAVHVHHHAGGVGQDREIPGAGDGPSQCGEDRARGFDQVPVGLQRAPQQRAGDGVKGYLVLRALATVQAAAPRTFDPRFDRRAAGALAVHHRAAGRVDAGQAVFGRGGWARRQGHGFSVSILRRLSGWHFARHEKRFHRKCRILRILCASGIFQGKY